MQEELETEATGSPIQLLAVNELGYEASLAGMASLGDIPLLQDTSEEEVWITWDVVYRDVIILDESGVQVGVYNLTVTQITRQSPS